jgi:hypothetical protein
MGNSPGRRKSAGIDPLVGNNEIAPKIDHSLGHRSEKSHAAPGSSSLDVLPRRSTSTNSRPGPGQTSSFRENFPEVFAQTALELATLLTSGGMSD